MKFNNENAKEQMTYVAPRMKVFQVQITSSLLQASQTGWGTYGAAGTDGEYEED